ncbi:MAG: SUMF1/EgtB/PvdO family nonheme iron enzyme [Thermoanaerobaculia bacterium]|nr:SUMF1/EgtB/PvdO family nonheme iron enzyme [Thermoanaerobaculia bacterium]
MPPALYACTSCGERVTDFLRQYAEVPLDGKYHVLSLLGIGGMGEVYKAIHLHLDALRVIKLMRANLVAEPGVRERFLREARLATKIQHPNVAALFDFSSLADGSWYMVWEYIDGVNLAQFVRDRGRLSAALAVRLAIQALQGFDAIHRAGIVHRDVSPENLMITRLEDGTERVKIIDLGVAKQQDDEGEQQTKTGVFVGKLKYASPEQLGALKAGDKIDGRADIYSFGLVLYEMLAGVAPFQAETPHHYLMMHLSQAAPPIARSSPGSSVPPAIEAIVLKALEKNRANRYQTAIEFAQALAAVPLPMIDAPTAVETLPPSSMIPTTMTPMPPAATPFPASRTPFPGQTAQRPLETPKPGDATIRRRSDVDPAQARRRELLEQITQALAARQLQHADVTIQNLKMHLGVRAESDADFRHVREELDHAAAEASRWYASEIQRARDGGHPKEVARLLEEREQALGRRLADPAVRVEAEQWLRRRSELLDRARSWINSESYASAREMLEDLANHLGMGAVKDEEFIAVEQSFHHAIHETNSRLAKSIARARDARDAEGVQKLLAWRDSKFGPRIEKDPPIAEAEEWLRQHRRASGPVLSHPDGGGRRGRVAAAVFVGVGLAAVAGWLFRDKVIQLIQQAAPPEATAAIKEIAKPKPVPPPIPERREDAPPLLGEAARAREGNRWTNPRDGAEYLWVPQTWLLIGCVSGDETCADDEKPAHTVGVDGFWMARHEVTIEAFAKWAAASGVGAELAPKGAREPGPDAKAVGARRREGTSWQSPVKKGQPGEPNWPVALVTWDEASAYCTAMGARLPSEAEWEAAARERDVRSVWPWGADGRPPAGVANTPGKGDSFTAYAPVGSFPANRLGVHDLAGNVWEWTGDWYGANYYGKSPEEKVAGPELGEARVIRGGSWASAAGDLRVSARRSLAPGERSVTVGFRCAADE